MRPTFYATKYDAKLTRKEIAARIRADIKAAIKAGELPAGLKVSVRKHGSSISCDVTAAPGVSILSETALRGEYGPGRYRHSEAARSLLARLDAIHGAYNFDGSEIETDYFHVNYYGSASFDWRLEDAERKAAERVAEMAEAAAVAKYGVQEECFFPTSSEAWAFMRACDEAGDTAGFPSLGAGPKGYSVLVRRKPLPACARELGCLCAGHGWRGDDAAAPCDTRETVSVEVSHGDA